MKITFVAAKGTYDYTQIGGTDSFVRRLTAGILENDKNIKIEWLFYNSKKEDIINHSSRFVSKYFLSFDDLLEYISEEKPAHVVCGWIYPSDRLKFADFRKNNRSILFHKLEFFYPKNLLVKSIKISEYLLYPYNGNIYCVSKRLFNFVKKWCNNVVYLLPPVPEDYFLTPEQKPVNNKIKITFLGRTDPRKGITEVIGLFKILKDNSHFECTIYGTYIRDDKEAFNIRNWLKRQDEITYVEHERQNFTPSIEEKVRQILKETDVFVQPYRSLDSTLDTPLLLLEAMASLCAVVTTAVGDVPALYGNRGFIVDSKYFVPDTLRVLSEISVDKLILERERVYRRNLNLDFKTSSVGKKFLESLHL